MKKECIIYDITGSELQDLLDSPTIVSRVMSNRDCGQRDAMAHITKIYNNMFRKEDKQTITATKTSDHPPCPQCGGIFFLRTGTCHVCQTCGASQGCS